MNNQEIKGRIELKHYAAFSNSKEGDTTFLQERDLDKAIEKLADCKADHIYICRHIYHNMTMNLSQDSLDRFIATDNPRLEFIKELSQDREFLKSRYDDTLRPPVGFVAEVFNEGCHIGSNTTIGEPALATERDEDGHIWRFPHIGGVRLGKNVWIGSNCNISRGVLEDTVIESDVTIDACVHVAHNCRIGERTQIAAGTILGGSVRIGHDCWIGLNATIDDHVMIGNNVIVGAAAHVRNNIENDGDIVAGNPAVSIAHKISLPSWKRYRMVGLHL